MQSNHGRNPTQSFDALRRFVRKPQRNVERCELCSSDLGFEHDHLIELKQRKIVCACGACALLFSGRMENRYKRVPRQIRLLSNFRMSDADWDSLLIPINLAFFFQNSLSARVAAVYPSPAGATESLLPLQTWNHIVQMNPVLLQMEADVEALLVSRVRSEQSNSAEYYLVPIDACYQLVGLIRMHWRGLSGGTEVWQKIGEFFARLRAKAQVVSEEMHA